MRRSLLLTVLVVLVTACGGTDEPGPTIDPVPDGSPDESPDDATDEPADEPAPDEPIVVPDDGGDGAAGGAAGSDPLLGPELQQVIPDAAERAGVAEGDVQITVTELVTWPDGSLGCPEPGMTYTQALVDGYRIVVEAGGASFTYHGQSGGDPIHCEQPQEPASVR